MKGKMQLHYGYIVVAGLMLLMIPQCFPMNVAGIFYSPVSEELGISVSHFGVHMTVLSLSMMLMIPFLSRIFNKVDSRILLSIMVILESGMFLVNSFAKSVWVFYITSFFLGISLASYNYLAIPILVNRWFLIKSATMIGFCGAAQGLAGMIFNFMGSILIETLGWRICYVIWAVITLVTGLPATLLIIRDHPSRKGLKAYGYVGTQADTYNKGKRSSDGARLYMRSATYLFLIFFIALLSLATSYNFYMNSYIQYRGVTMVMAGIASSTVMLGTMVGKILVGFISDKNLNLGLLFGVIPALIAVPVLILADVDRNAMILGACFLFGLTYATVNVLGPAICRVKFGVENFDKLWPPATMMIAFIAAVGSMVWGNVIERIGYQITMWIVLLILFMSLLAGWLGIKNKTNRHNPTGTKLYKKSEGVR